MVLSDLFGFLQNLSQFPQVSDKEWLILVQHGTLLHFQICIQTLLVL